MDDQEKRILRAMTPEQKLRAAIQLYYLARQLKAAGLRMQHPEWNEEQVDAGVREIFLYGRE